jgi:hypothetical protein
MSIQTTLYRLQDTENVDESGIKVPRVRLRCGPGGELVTH